MNRTGNRKHFASLVRRAARGDQRAGGDGRLDDQAAARQSADQSIAPREVVRDGRRAESEFRKQQSATRDFGGEFSVARRIDDIDAGAEDRNRRAGAGQAAAMCCGVDAQRKPGDDRESGGAERCGEMLRVALPLSRSVAAADNGERGLWQQLTATVPIKQRRWVRDPEEPARIQLAGQGDGEAVLYLRHTPSRRARL